MMLISLTALFVILIFLVQIVHFILIVMTDSRGIRNNNPFNIRYSRNKWLGKYYPPFKKDSDFEEFKDIKYGIRAAIRLFQSYFNQGLRTPRELISRFAPASENDINSYFKYLSQFLNINIPITCNADLYTFMSAVSLYESGYTLTRYEFVRVFSYYFNKHFNFFPKHSK